MTGELTLLVGNRLDQARGEAVACSRKPSTLLAELTRRQSADCPDAWVILGTFHEDRRGKGTWRSASGISVDLDWEDPTLPKEDGAHQAIPEPDRERIQTALREYTISGLAYLTRRGVRVMHVLDQDVDDEHAYAELVEAAADQVLRHVGEHGVPLWRDGRTGLRFDATSRSPAQPMRLPLPGQPTLLMAGDSEVCETVFQQDGAQHMDLEAALPGDLAGACKRIGAWVQIAPEVVVTGLMATASAAIGNTRRVVARGMGVPLSLHYLTVLPSGSGKGTVRQYLRGAAGDIERDVLRRREEARRERQDYEAQLERWKFDGRSQKRRESRGPRPEPPLLSPHGGERVSFVVSEANLEGVVATLEDTPRGFLWASDEAHEVLGMLGRYGDKGARSVDAARLRRLMDGAPVEAHRARSNASSVRRLPRPFLAFDADVQPGVVESLFNREDYVSGMAARVLIHCPLPMQGSRSYVAPPPEPGPEVLELLRARLAAMWTIELRLEEGVPQHEPLTLDDEAELLWAQELERLERRYPNAGDSETGALGHARGRLLRLSGVLALLRDPGSRTVSAEDMRRAIVHVRYHLAHYRALLGGGDSEQDRLDRLGQQVQKILARQPKKGVRATDLRRHVSKKTYGGPEGLQRAFADLHALGWILRRRETKGQPGRPPAPAFFPPADSKSRSAATPGKPSHKPHKTSTVGFGGLGDAPAGAGERTRPVPGEIPERLRLASNHLIETGTVVLPARGIRTACPACESPDGLGVLPDDPLRWYCHSDRHTGPRSGCAVDYLLAEQLQRMPLVPEALKAAEEILAGAHGRGAASA